MKILLENLSEEIKKVQEKIKTSCFILENERGEIIGFYIADKYEMIIEESVFICWIEGRGSRVSKLNKKGTIYDLSGIKFVPVSKRELKRWMIEYITPLLE